MNIETHEIEGKQIAEVTSDTLIINEKEDGLDLLGNLYFQGFDHVIIYKRNITPDFFNLTGLSWPLLEILLNTKVRALEISFLKVIKWGKSISVNHWQKLW